MAKTIDLLRQARHAVALTGAGISTPSGIPDFRGNEESLWQQVDPFAVASIYAFSRRPQDFYDWIHPLAGKIMAAVPNQAHLALARLEACGRLKALITQNIDMLHSRAGSQTVYELHGHLRQATCIRCYHVTDGLPILEKFVADGQMPLCPVCGGVLKPDVILFGEQLPVSVLAGSRREARQCDLMIVAGSSLEVFPAAELPRMAKENHARLVIINNHPTHLDDVADVLIRADVCDVLPGLVEPFLP